MTLVAGFVCSDGMLLCADTQETAGDRRGGCTKIDLFQVGDFDIAIAGSGNNADLLEAFVQQLKDADAKPSKIEEVKSFLHFQLLTFAREEACLYDKKERATQYMIAACNVFNGAYEMWVTRSSRLVKIDKFQMIGWDEILYRHSVDRLLKRHTLTLSTAFPLATYLFSLADATSIYVDGKMSALVVSQYARMFMERDYVIQEFQGMTEVYRELLEGMLLTCADTALDSDTFSKKFEEFRATILKLREDYFQTAGKRQVLRLFRGEIDGASYRSLPPNAVVTFMSDGRTIAAENNEEVNRFREMAKDATKELMRFTQGPIPTVENVPKQPSASEKSKDSQ